MAAKRIGFGSKLGIVLATAGSAVGLGNVWRFPYLTGENGGAAFLLIYIICIFLLGIPGMVSEFVIGRHGQANAARSYDKLSQGRSWRWVGYLGIVTASIILGFYAVVAGWCLQYLYASILGHVTGDAETVKNYFAAFSSDAVQPVVWCNRFDEGNIQGYRKGLIEKIGESKVLMIEASKNVENKISSFELENLAKFYKAETKKFTYQIK